MKNSSDITTLEPQNVWRIFSLISSVPHPSGHEEALVRALAAYAKERGLAVRIDSYGNCRIDRPASPGYETSAKILFQAHLDMVPAALDPGFDFTKTAVSPVAEGGWVHAAGTTLGGDDGIGAALSLALLCDESLHCGPLAAVFTREEETGLKGAAQLDPAFLAGDILLNLDNEDGTICIGCAGGARTEFFFSPRYHQPPENASAWAITLGGLAGGHSGICIHENRGNAIRFLAQFIDIHTHFHCGELFGGSADNQIPDRCTAVGVSEHPLEEMQESAARFSRFIRSHYRVPETFAVTFEKAPLPRGVWTEKFQHDFLTALSLAPDAVLEMDETLGIVRTSSNLAAVIPAGKEICVRSSQRSLIDARREMATEALKRHFDSFGACRSTMESVYPAWTPHADMPIVRTAQKLWKELFGTELAANAIHAGVEAGWFSRKNPSLQILSLGPVSEKIHTPEERLCISSVQQYWHYLRALISRIG